MTCSEKWPAELPVRGRVLPICEKPWWHFTAMVSVCQSSTRLKDRAKSMEPACSSNREGVDLEEKRASALATLLLPCHSAPGVTMSFTTSPVCGSMGSSLTESLPERARAPLGGIAFIHYPLLRLTLADYGRILFSSFLDTLAGYGYRPAKALRSYLIVIVFFALLYWLFGYLDGIQAATAIAHRLHRTAIVMSVLTLPESLVYSLTSFHGRGFFPGAGINLEDLLVIIAALEAMVGLVIEVSFIATFTQRFLSR